MISIVAPIYDSNMISVVVPIYNEEELIVRFHEAVASALESAHTGWEVVYVNDGSTDCSLEMLRALQAMDSHVVVVELSRNWGHMGAITAGIKTAHGNAVILMDGDLQDPPEVIPSLVAEWLKGFDVVYGVRERRRESAAKEAARRIFYRVYRRLSYLKMPLDAGDFCAMRREVVDAIDNLPERNRFVRGLRTWVLRIVANLCRDRLRRRKFIAPTPEGEDPFEHAGLSFDPVLDWDAALAVQEPHQLDEILYVLELANLQLAELEAYDRLLDTLTAARAKAGVKNTATAFGLLLDIVEKHLDEIPQRKSKES